jgi:hypothetical protein
VIIPRANIAVEAALFVLSRADRMINARTVELFPNLPMRGCDATR